MTFYVPKYVKRNVLKICRLYVIKWDRIYSPLGYFYNFKPSAIAQTFEYLRGGVLFFVHVTGSEGDKYVGNDSDK